MGLFINTSVECEYMPKLISITFYTKCNQIGISNNNSFSHYQKEAEKCSVGMEEVRGRAQTELIDGDRLEEQFINFYWLESNRSLSTDTIP